MKGEAAAADVLSRARAGDARAFRAIYDANAGLAYGFLRRMLLEDAAAEDALQETFVRVLRALDRFDPSGPARLSTWIVAIARRVALDALDQRSRTGRLSGEIGRNGVEAAAGGPPDPAERADLRRALEAAVAALPEAQRTVFILCECCHLGYAEIAAVEQIDLGTVKSRLHRARAALQGKLKGYLPEERQVAHEGNDEKRAIR